MNIKLYPITESMKQSKCNELVKNIKQLVTENRFLTDLYVTVKPIIKEYRNDDKVLQTIYMFLAKNSNEEIAQHNCRMLTKFMLSEIDKYNRIIIKAWGL